MFSIINLSDRFSPALDDGFHRDRNLKVFIYWGGVWVLWLGVGGFFWEMGMKGWEVEMGCFFFGGFWGFGGFKEWEKVLGWGLRVVWGGMGERLVGFCLWYLGS